jgi:multidrug efflux pump
VAGVSAFIGAGSMNPTLNQGQLSIVLKSRGQRDGLDGAGRLQKAAAGMPGAALYLKPVQDVTLDTRGRHRVPVLAVGVDGACCARTPADDRGAAQAPQNRDVDNNLAERAARSS